MKTILVSAGVALLVSLFGTPLIIKIFVRRGDGQQVREDGPAAHSTKRGTPTMGGTAIVIATIVGYLVGHVTTGFSLSASGLLVLGLMAGLGVVGFLDDFLKLYRRRSLGLRSGAKLAGQCTVGVLFAVAALHYPNAYDLTPGSAYVSFLRDVGPAIGVEVGHREAGVRQEGAGDQVDLVARHQLLRDAHGIAWIGVVVATDQLELLAVDAACRVDLVDRQFHPLLVGLEEGRLCLVAVDLADLDHALRVRRHECGDQRGDGGCGKGEAQLIHRELLGVRKQK